MAVEFSLIDTVRCLCKLGVNLNLKDPVTGLPPVWTAIENGSLDIARVLVEHGCDLIGWSVREDGICEQNMLHRAIEYNLSDAAIFLIKSGCDMNSLKRYKDQQSDDLQTPLHCCILWNLDEVALTLIENGAKIDLQDSDGRTAAHLAVQEHSDKILRALLTKCETSSLLLRDRYGMSPLAFAMHTKNNAAAQAIVKKAPHTAMQMNGNGENLLHTAVKARDLESVLFLLALDTDVNVYTQDSSRVSALHICAKTGNEIIMRNLILAGADVNAVSAKGFTPLHLAAYNNHGSLCRILLENGAQPDMIDRMGNNALHAAVSQGSTLAVNLLLTESQIDARALNSRHQTPLILVASGVSSASSVEIFRTFMNADPQYPLEERDDNGNTLFLIAYINGNAQLCKEVLRYGACLAVCNNFGLSVFKHETPTKQLLFSLLDNLVKEPKWAEGDACSECNIKFSLTMRKHHCRHCGRLVCARCSDNTMPILKFEFQKPVRVCQICSDVLTMGTSQ